MKWVGLAALVGLLSQLGISALIARTLDGGSIILLGEQLSYVALIVPLVTLGITASLSRVIYEKAGQYRHVEAFHFLMPNVFLVLLMFLMVAIIANHDGFFDYILIYIICIGYGFYNYINSFFNLSGFGKKYFYSSAVFFLGSWFLTWIISLFASTEIVRTLPLAIVLSLFTIIFVTKNWRSNYKTVSLKKWLATFEMSYKFVFADYLHFVFYWFPVLMVIENEIEGADSFTFLVTSLAVISSFIEVVNRVSIRWQYKIFLSFPKFALFIHLLIPLVLLALYWGLDYFYRLLEFAFEDDYLRLDFVFYVTCIYVVSVNHILFLNMATCIEWRNGVRGYALLTSAIIVSVMLLIPYIGIDNCLILYLLVRMFVPFSFSIAAVRRSHV